MLRVWKDSSVTCLKSDSTHTHRQLQQPGQQNNLFPKVVILVALIILNELAQDKHTHNMTPVA